MTTLKKTLAKNRPWYDNGLTFSCQADCRACCQGEGDVWITREEILDMAGYLKLEEHEFRALYTRRDGFRVSLREKSDFDCVLLGEKGCRVYPVRPAQCRQFPFWSENLASREAWNACAEDCPGMNQGRTYGLDEIRRISNEEDAAETPRGNT